MERRCPGCMKLKEDVPVCPHCGFDESAAVDAHHLPVNTILRGQYQVGKVLGQGGFGITYLGWDLYLDAPVAIKEFYPSSLVYRENSSTAAVRSTSVVAEDAFRLSKERFMKEAKALAKFTEIPEIVQIRSLFPENNTVYIVMEYIEGINLRKYVRENGRLSFDEAMTYLLPVMDALERVHAAGIVHRDISPDNIMLLPDGRVKLLDFGAVRSIEQADPEAELSHSTQSILKHGYAPIEQYQTRGGLGPWTDVYALCATLYFCMVSSAPPNAPERVMGDDTLVLENVLPGLTKQQYDALYHGLSLKAKDRPGSVAQLRNELMGLSAKENNSTEEKKPPIAAAEKKPRGIKTKNKSKKSPLIIAAAIAVLALAAALGIWAVSGSALFLSSAAYKQENILMSASTTVNPGSYAFNTPVKRNEISSITFLDSVRKVPESAVDASELKNGKVLAWAESSEDKFHLYIAAKGGVMAPENCQHLFSSMVNLEHIEFGSAFDTSGSVKMNHMFYNCSSLVGLEMSTFDTSKVTDMSSMFSNCMALSTLELSGFDTSRVEDMSMMFSGCIHLSELNVGSFDTAAVTNMRSMFSSCHSLNNLNISSFDTSRVKDMSWMFWGCKALKNINLGNFETDSVKTYDNFMDLHVQVDGQLWTHLFR